MIWTQGVNPSSGLPAALWHPPAKPTRLIAMPFSLSPQSIDALADIITGGPGMGGGPPPIVNGSRVPSLTSALLDINRGFEAGQVLPRIIEAAADPRDFIQEPERHIAVVDYLNRALRFDGFELQQQGRRMQLIEAGKNVPVLAELAGLSEVIDLTAPSLIARPTRKMPSPPLAARSRACAGRSSSS